MENKEKAPRGKKVFVGLSGGVDSSVAAHLLKSDGYDVVGVHLRCWNKNGCDEREAEDARRVAEKIGIPFYIFDLEREYKELVVDYMIDGYKKGITPNPDIMCNKEIKFGLFLEKALRLGADFMATGHYARLFKNGGVYSLYEAKDKNKDQSYFLWTLTQAQLKHVLFPLGELTKPEVRKIAQDAGLHIADKKDSQGICFVGKVTLKEFLGEYLPKIEGKALNLDGEIVGSHEGSHFYTIGQRHGFGIGGGEPYYVAEKNTEDNTVVLATRKDRTLYRKEITLASANFIVPVPWNDSSESFHGGLEVFARIRYRQNLVKARLYSLPTNYYLLKFDKHVEFVAPGQSAVFYSADGQILGGGIIL